MNDQQWNTLVSVVRGEAVSPLPTAFIIDIATTLDADLIRPFPDGEYTTELLVMAAKEETQIPTIAVLAFCGSLSVRSERTE